MRISGFSPRKSGSGRPTGPPRGRSDDLGQARRQAPPGLMPRRAKRSPVEAGSKIVHLAEVIGNVRIDSATVGFYANAPGKPGYATIVSSMPALRFPVPQRPP